MKRRNQSDSNPLQNIHINEYFIFQYLFIFFIKI